MSKWIPVLVRLEDLDLVTSYIGELEASRDDSHLDPMIELTHSGSDPAQVSLSEPTELDSRPSWDLEDLQRLAKGETATTSRWARALDVCASSPETYLPTSEVAKRSGMSIREWRDAPRKITRHLRVNYPNVPRESDGNAVWPLHAKSVPEHPGEVSWAISSEMARLWKEVRS